MVLCDVGLDRLKLGVRSEGCHGCVFLRGVMGVFLAGRTVLQIKFHLEAKKNTSKSPDPHLAPDHVTFDFEEYNLELEITKQQNRWLYRAATLPVDGCVHSCSSWSSFLVTMNEAQYMS